MPISKLIYSFLKRCDDCITYLSVTESFCECKYLKFHTYFQDEVIDPWYATKHYANHKCKKTQTDRCYSACKKKVIEALTVQVSKWTIEYTHAQCTFAKTIFFMDVDTIGTQYFS